jgi:hypothetical protein
VENRQIMFTWLPPSDPDIGGYVLKWTSNLNKPTWAQGSWERDIIPHDSLTVTVNARTGSYMLRTIDTSGNLSADFALVRTNIPDLDDLDLVEIVQEDPAFAGRHFQTTSIAGALRLESKSATPPCELYPYGVYTFQHLTDVGALYDVHLSADIDIDGDACDPFVMADWVPNLAALQAMMPPATGEIDAVVQVRTAAHLSDVIADWVPNLAAPAADPIAVHGSPSDWGGWTNLTAGVYSGRYFEFRVVMATQNPSLTPSISRARVKVDMPERRSAGHNIAIAAGGTRVLFSDGAFYKPPAVATTHDHAQDNDTLKINNIGVDGFDAEVWRGGAPVTGQIDYVAVGYGRLQSTLSVSVKAGEDDAPNLLPDAMRLARLPAYYN